MLCVLLIGLTAFLYQLALVIGKIQTWEVIWNPPTVADMLQAVVYGLMAVLGALGLNVPDLMRTWMPKMMGGADGPPPPTGN